VQIVDYDSVDGGLLLSDGDELTYCDLTAGRDLEYTLEDRHCAGTIHDESHIDCEHPAAPYCGDHSHIWVCARCTGTCLKDEMDCFDDHAIYLAAFAPDQFKVGVTKHWRLETRLREQGADRAAHIRPSTTAALLVNSKPRSPQRSQTASACPQNSPDWATQSTARPGRRSSRSSSQSKPTHSTTDLASKPNR